MSNKNSTILVNDEKQIEAFVHSRSVSMYNYMKNSSANFTLWSKNLLHSDITNRGKRNGKEEGLDNNFLYYLTIDEMQKIQKQFPNKPFESAKQSNIGMPIQFYKDIGIPRLKRRKGKQRVQHEHVKLNDYMEVYLVNDSMKYFTQKYTQIVLEKLNKLDKNSKVFNDNNDINLNRECSFTKIQITEAIHGLGTAKDKEFHKLRLSMFLNDTIIFLVEHNRDNKKLYIMLEKNPKFFTIIGESDTAWEKYLITQRQQEVAEIKGQVSLNTKEEIKSRRLQSAWKDRLAKEMMTYTTDEGKVFCPFTGISANFNEFSMLFIASHIKRHADCKSDKESFDTNNGLLLSSNADVLFDKYMITIDDNKKIIFSFLLEKDYSLRNQLLLNQPVFQLVLNEKRMKNLEEHRKIFYKKEQERKKISW